MKSKHWTVALDLTEMDSSLLDYTAFLAGIMEPQKITLLHVMEISHADPDYRKLFPGRQESIDEIKAIVEDELNDQLARFVGTDIQSEVRVVAGEVTETMIQELKKLDPDLLLLGKKTGYEGEGVISRKVVRYVPCSVLFIPEMARHRVEKMLIPVNFNEHSADALHAGISFSRLCHADIRAVHIYEYPPQFFPGIPEEEFQDKMKGLLEKQRSTLWKTYLLPDDVDLEFVLNRNKRIPDKIYELAVREQADMLLAGARNRSSLSNVLIDDLADRLIQYSYGVPLLILKDKNKYKGLLSSLSSG
jgi:nucleotide-binding universal stress UspA family protein